MERRCNRGLDVYPPRLQFYVQNRGERCSSPLNGAFPLKRKERLQLLFKDKDYLVQEQVQP